MEQLYLTSNPGPEIDEQNIYDTINKYQVVKSPRLHCFYHIIILIFGAKIQKKLLVVIETFLYNFQTLCPLQNSEKMCSLFVHHIFPNTTIFVRDLEGKILLAPADNCQNVEWKLDGGRRERRIHLFGS